MKINGRFIICISALFLLFSCAEDTAVRLTEGPGDTALLKTPNELDESFKCLENGHEISLEYEKLSLQWNYINAEFADYASLFYDRFAAGGTFPQTVLENSEIAVNFDAYSPAAVTVMRDTKTYDRDSADEAAEPVDYTVNIANNASEQTIVFSIEYRESKVLYYTVEAKWSNGNQILYAFAVKRP